MKMKTLFRSTGSRIALGARLAFGLTLASSLGAAWADDATDPKSKAADKSLIATDVVVITGQSERAATLAPTQSTLEATEPQSVISQDFIENSKPKTSDFMSLLQITPSAGGLTSGNGPGLGEAKTTLRGFKDGEFNVTFDAMVLGTGSDGQPVFLSEIWPTTQDVSRVVGEAISGQMYTRSYQDVFAGDERWKAIPIPAGDSFTWDPQSTYVRRPPYFDGMKREPEPLTDISGARVLAILGDSVTTDHISPAGSIKGDSPAGRYLQEHGVAPKDFNSYGSRRGNHEVMIRGTFANIRLRNQLAPGSEGGVTLKLGPTGGGAPTQMSIYEASEAYQAEGTPLVVLAGKEYGSGSSRDWAAKGTALLGVRAVIAESYERIHRSNLIGMGVLPLQFTGGDNAASLGLTGHETFTVEGVVGGDRVPRELTVKADEKAFTVVVRIDTPGEQAYYRNGGIMPYVLRSLL